MHQKSALFIGRFQPFHLGHLSVIKKAIREVGFLIIGIGSAEENYLPQNPFTAGERFEMIKLALAAEKIDPKKYAIVPIRNINNYGAWCRHVSLLIPKFDIVYTGSEIVKELFSAEKKYEIREIDFEIKISATKVRELIKNGGNWKKWAPKETGRYIEKIKGEERIKMIFQINK